MTCVSFACFRVNEAASRGSVVRAHRPATAFSQQGELGGFAVRESVRADSARDATAAREAYRQVSFSTVAPLGRLVQDELRANLEDDSITLDWTELRASDVQGRARAFQSMVGGGMAVERAAALAGLMESEG